MTPTDAVQVEWYDDVPLSIVMGDLGPIPPIKRVGSVIGSRRGFWGGTVLIVALDSGRVMDVPADRVKVVNT